jgi:hypothetical protein
MATKRHKKAQKSKPRRPGHGLSTATNKPEEVKKRQAELAKYPDVGPMLLEKK